MMNVNTTNARPLTVKAATEILKGMGGTIKFRDGEYRVAVKGEPESAAYYTSDLNDAMFTFLKKANARTAEKVAMIRNQITAFGLRRAH